MLSYLLREPNQSAYSAAATEMKMETINIESIACPAGKLGKVFAVICIAIFFLILTAVELVFVERLDDVFAAAIPDLSRAFAVVAH